MSQYAVLAVYPFVLWWFSTGLILYIVGLPRATFRWSVLAASVIFVAALYGLATTSNDTTVAGAYLGFSYALLVWGAQEIGFLTGMVTGPRPRACPEGCRGWRRFSLAIQAILYHELALVASGLAIVAVTWKGANQFGTWTFLILWTMRISSQLNLFLGVRFVYAEFLPKHLSFVGSFFARRTMNALFPVSVSLATVVVGLLIARASQATASPHETIGYSLLAVLLALAVLEHLFMILPLPVVALWSWGMRSRRQGRPPEPSDIRATGAAAALNSSHDRHSPRSNLGRKDQGEHKPEMVHPEPVQTAKVRFP